MSVKDIIQPTFNIKAKIRDSSGRFVSRSEWTIHTVKFFIPQYVLPFIRIQTIFSLFSRKDRISALSIDSYYITKIVKNKVKWLTDENGKKYFTTKREEAEKMIKSLNQSV